MDHLGLMMASRHHNSARKRKEQDMIRMKRIIGRSTYIKSFIVIELI